MNLNTDAFRRSTPWIVAAAVPVAAYIIYRNLTPNQKRKFKRSLAEGTLAFTSALVSRAINAYKKRSAATATVENDKRFATMAAIPNSNETETTIGNERW